MAKSESDYGAIVATPLGKLGFSVFGNALTGLEFLAPEAPERLPSDPAAQAAVTQLQAYFADPGVVFTLPLFSQGTPFQERVWQALRTIPSGSTVTYGGLARELKTSPRAIGNACRANPLPIFVPCHRVVSSQGLGGYSGAVEGSWVDIKVWLLQHEARRAVKSCGGESLG